jgi:hypothetical protein
MKEKNCVDLKIAAYYQAVRELEGKFHGLELHHVLRDYNKAADVLAKTASSCKPVPHGVFASNQQAHSVRIEGEKPPEPEGPEVMKIDQPPELNLEDPDWHFPILEWIVERKMPSDQTEACYIARGPKHSSSLRTSSTSEVQQAYSCGASLEIKEKNYFSRSMPARAGIMLAQGLLSGKLSDRVSTSPH